MKDWQSTLANVEAVAKRSPSIASELRNVPAWLLPTSDILAEDYPTIYQRLAPGPEVRRGTAILVGYKDDQDAGLLYSVAHTQTPQEDMQVFQSAVNAWRDAVAAVPRCLPYFIMPTSWRPHRATPPIQSTQLEDYVHAQSGNGKGATELDGPSFGLGFAFAIASEYLALRTDDDVVGLACCDAYGRLSRVDGLAKKLLAILNGAPRIRRVLLSTGQRANIDDVRLIDRYEADGTFEFIEVERLNDAFAHIFSEREEDFRSSVRKKVQADAQNSNNFLEEMFDFLLCEPQRPNTYRPFIHTCDLLAQQFPEDQRDRLAFMRAIASRREGDDEDESKKIPTHAWFSAQPKWQRRVILSAYCQHSYDTGVPTSDTLTQWLREEQWLKQGAGELVTPHAPSCGYYDLQLLNAYATLLEHEGELVRSQTISYEVANEWTKRRMYAQASWSLQRALILAGVLADDEKHTQSQRLAQHVLAFINGRYVGRLFILLAQLRAAIAMQDDEFLQTFTYPSDDELERVHPHVRYGLERFLMQQNHKDPQDSKWLLWAEKARARLNEDDEHNPKDAKLRKEYRMVAALQDAAYNRNEQEVAQRSRTLAEHKQLFGFVLNAVQKTTDAPIADDASLIEQVRVALDIYPY